MSTKVKNYSDIIATDPAKSTSSRRISLANREGLPKGSLRGAGVTSKGKRRIMYFESGAELKAQLILQARPDVREIYEQLPRVQYVDERGKHRTHTFDILAHMTNGERIAIAVKPYEVAKRKGFFEELAIIAPQVPQEVADRVVLLTDRQLRGPALFKAELIHAVRLDEDPESDACVRAALDQVSGSLTIADLVARSGNKGRSFRAIVRFIADGMLEVCTAGRIDYCTVVARATEGVAA